MFYSVTKTRVSFLSFFMLLFPLNSVCHDPAQHYHLYLWANYNQLQDNHSIAQQCYESLFKHQASPHLYPGFLMHLSQTKQFNEIVRLIPIIEATQKQDLQTQMIFVNALENSGKRAEVTQRLMHLSKQHPENSEVIYYTAAAHAENGRYTEALSSIDTYLANAHTTSKNFLFYYLKAQIFSKTGNNAQAISNAKKSVELFPAFDQGWLLLGLIYEMQGSFDEALQHYQTCLHIVGAHPLLERQIMNIQLKRQQLVHHAGSNQTFRDALNAYDKKEYLQALQIIEKTPLLENHIPSRLLKIELLCKVNKAHQALTLITQWLQSDETNETWYRTLHLLHNAGVPRTKIIAILSTIESKNGKNILALLYQADIYIRTHDTKQAIVYLNKALQNTSNPQLRTKIFFQLALIHYRDENWDNMLEVLVEGKKLNQDFPPLLNLLAYHYATKENNLKEAEELIHRALKKDANPHFLDTHALILYKQRKFDEAYALLTRVAQQLPHDSTVLYHLAKTNYKKGSQQEALTVLVQAINSCSITTDKQRYQQCLDAWQKK